MSLNVLKISLCCFVILCVTQLFAQGTRCSDIQPFCAGGDELVFPNSNKNLTNIIFAEEGPNYGCLGMALYPSWFYLQIEDSGDLDFLISQAANKDGTGDPLDVDFVIWGPFDKMDNYCSDSLLSGENLIDCSYDEHAVETVSIEDAQEGEIYVFAIMNYSSEPGFIKLKQTNTGLNAGATDCTILDGLLGEDKVVCGNNEIILDAETDGASGYKWYFFDEELDDYVVMPNETASKLRVASAGNYKVFVEDGAENNNLEDEIEVFFYKQPSIKDPEDAIILCEGDTVVDLTQKELELVGENVFDEGYEIQYFESENDVSVGRNIDNPSTYNLRGREIFFARIRDINSGCYSDIAEIQLDIRALPQLDLPESFNVCVDHYGFFEQELVLGQDFGKSYQYAWYNGGQLISSEYDLYLYEQSDDPEYTLVVTEQFTGCEISFNTTLKYLSEPSSVKIDVLKGNFGSNWNVEILAEPKEGQSSKFEYSLDGERFTTNPIFKNIPKGLHKVQVREVNGCGNVITEEFTVIGYDFFFTPNGDGFNDYWTVTQDPDYRVISIEIFNRYGNFLKKIDPNSEGWNGIVNGKLLSEDDYWFKLEYVTSNSNNKKQFSAHFSLRR